MILRPHQLYAGRFIADHFGLILYHSTGSGKTATALAAMHQFSDPCVVIGTKASQKAFRDTAQALGYDWNTYTFYTYTSAKKAVMSQLTVFHGCSVIVDEAHHLRNETMGNGLLLAALERCRHLLLLTATPVINHLSDLAVLVNLVKQRDALPIDRGLFDHLYYDEEKMMLKHGETFQRNITEAISYYQQSDRDANYATSTVHERLVKMDYFQMTEYASYMNKVLYEGRTVVTYDQITPIDYATLSRKRLNSFLMVTRQISNCAEGRVGPKMSEMLEVILAGPKPVIVYSNFLARGLYPVGALLADAGLVYLIISGFSSEERTSNVVDRYNRGEIQVLLISSAGSESLDFQGTRQIHVMEPHWNESKIDQVLGRAIRFQSHRALPLEQRHVDIYRWISVFPDHIRNASADQYLTYVSHRKADLWLSFQGHVEAASIEKMTDPTSLDS